MRSDEVLDEALDSMRDAGPELRDGLTNHAPMAIEALCAMGRPDAVDEWLAAYRGKFVPAVAATQAIAADRWKGWRWLDLSVSPIGGGSSTRNYKPRRGRQYSSDGYNDWLQGWPPPRPTA